MQELRWHAGNIRAAHAPRKHAGQEIAKGGGEETDAHRLAGEARGRELRHGAQADRAEEKLGDR